MQTERKVKIMIDGRETIYTVSYMPDCKYLKINRINPIIMNLTCTRRNSGFSVHGCPGNCKLYEKAPKNMYSMRDRLFILLILVINILLIPIIQYHREYIFSPIMSFAIALTYILLKHVYMKSFTAYNRWAYNILSSGSPAPVPLPDYIDVADKIFGEIEKMNWENIDCDEIPIYMFALSFMSRSRDKPLSMKASSYIEYLKTLYDSSCGEK